MTDPQDHPTRLQDDWDDAVNCYVDSEQKDPAGVVAELLRQGQRLVDALASRASPLQAFADRLAQSQEDLPEDVLRVLREHLPELYIDTSSPAPPALSRETPADEAKS